jgi:DNA-directed RNA polymerase II subunit RPB2
MWGVVDAYFADNSLIQQQILSFHSFIETHISSIIKEQGDIVLRKTIDGVEQHKATISFQDISLATPTFTEPDGQVINIFPKDARLRNLTYSSSLFIQITLETENQTEVFEQVFLGKIPIMVRSKYCNLRYGQTSGECENDYGGYFIVSGSEKVLIPQEKMNNNQVYVFERNTNKITHEAELRSIHELENRSASTVKITIVKMGHGDIRLRAQIPFLKTEVPVFCLFALLNEDDPMQYFEDEDCDILYSSFLEYKTDLENEVSDVEKKLMCSKEDAIFKYFIPHMETLEGKKHFFVHMINEIVSAFRNKRSCDDRDHFKNKRIDTTGDLLAGLFRQLWRKMRKELVNLSQKNFDNGRMFNLTHIVKSKIISNGLKYAMSTGNWGLGTSAGMRTGVSQVLNRHSYIASLSHLRRINSPIGKEGKN